MNREEFIKAFADLPPEEQDAIRAEIAGKATVGEEGEFDSPMEMCKAIMEKIEAGEDPMTICKDMMTKCCS